MSPSAEKKLFLCISLPSSYPLTPSSLAGFIPLTTLPPALPPFQVVKQDKPFLTLASVNPSSLSSFISRLPVGARRVGLLYGWPQEGKEGKEKGREGGKKEGHVAAVLEVEEEWQEHE